MPSAPSLPTQSLTRLTNPSSSLPRPAVHAVTFSAGSGQYILTGSQDRKVRLWNPWTGGGGGKLVQTYAAHGYEVLDLDVGEGNERFVSCGGDKGVFLWDVATAQTLRRFTGHAARVNSVSFGGSTDTPGGESVIVSGSFDGTVKVWDCRSRSTQAIMTFSEARDGVSSVCVRDHEIYAGSTDGRVRVYDLAMGCVDTDVIGPAAVTSVSVTKAGDAYLVSSLDSTVRLMDRGSGKCLKAFGGGGGGGGGGFVNETYRVRSCLGMADAVVVSGGEDGRVWGWDVLSGEVVAKVAHVGEGSGEVERKSGKRDVVSAVAWNQLRKVWASAGGDGQVVIWGSRGEDDGD